MNRSLVIGLRSPGVRTIQAYQLLNTISQYFFCGEHSTDGDFSDAVLHIDQKVFDRCQDILFSDVE